MSMSEWGVQGGRGVDLSVLAQNGSSLDAKRLGIYGSHGLCTVARCAGPTSLIDL